MPRATAFRSNQCGTTPLTCLAWNLASLGILLGIPEFDLYHSRKWNICSNSQQIVQSWPETEKAESKLSDIWKWLATRPRVTENQKYFCLQSIGFYPHLNIIFKICPNKAPNRFKETVRSPTTREAYANKSNPALYKENKPILLPSL